MLKKFKIGLFFVLFSIYCEASTISDAELKQNAIDLESVLKKAMYVLKVPGAAFVVARKNKIIHLACFGKADQKGTPVYQDTLFALSSLTKNVSSILVGALIDEGKIKLDDKVRKYIPEFFIGNEDISAKFTVRDLISHRSGLKHFLADSLWSSGFTKSQMINSLKYINNVSGFRKQYGYQNIIFGIIEDVLEKASGKSYSQLLDKYIISKLKLQNTTCLPLFVVGSWFEQLLYNFRTYGFLYTFKNIFSITKKKVTTPHTIFNKKLIHLKPNDYFQRVLATSGVSMSITDLGIWMRMLLGNGAVDKSRVVQETTFKELSSNQVKIDNIKNNEQFPKNRLHNLYYGIGIFGGIYSDNGKNSREIFFHMGGVYGTSTFLAYFPKEDIAIAVVCNLGSIAVTAFSELMVWHFFDKCFKFKKVNWVQEEIDKKKKFEKESVLDKQRIEENDPGPHADLEKYTGVYTSKIYGEMKVEVEKDCLTIDNGIRKAKLNHVNRNIFKFPAYAMCENYFDRNEYVVFDPKGEGDFNSLYISCFAENQNIFEKKKK
jgi:CubicO group peptidase (beta-lactamase class C family)